MIDKKTLFAALDECSDEDMTELLIDLNGKDQDCVGFDIYRIVESYIKHQPEGDHESDTEFRDNCDRDAKEAAR